MAGGCMRKRIDIGRSCGLLDTVITCRLSK